MSIELINVTKHYRTLQGRHTVYRNFNLFIPRNQNIGIIGRNGAGKSTLLRMISGAELPDSGRVVRKMKVSWPLGFTGFFAMDLTGAENAAFAARLYGKDPKEVVEYATEWSELGKFMEWPVKGYSTGMRSRLGFALSLAIRFDCILIDEALGTGDAGFREKAMKSIEELRNTSSFIMVTHDLKEVARSCDRVIVIGGPEPVISDDVRDAIKRYLYEHVELPKMEAGSMNK